ncbi:drebrin-like protein B [Maniola jurtina]|uniref:drebrin-like protein B n=1 Tax=Maniola jurtina TaxID=191418 RepID=UPI001E68AD47|nr:drebrin-like protein B [Maniola jurtina]
MAINLEKHKEALVAAWKDVLDEKTDTNWALFGYDGLTNDLKYISKGDGGLTELIDDFNSGKIQYAFLKVDVPTGSISKYVLINWQGEGAPTVRKGTCANHIKHVAQMFTGFHLTMHARTEDDLDEKLILDKLSKAGSAFNFKTSRTEDLPQSGPVGTAYRKVNPVQEINSKERDQFWLKEEQEEKKRVEAERKRREEEKKKAEEDVRRRDELEAAKRAKAEQKPPSPEGGVSASEVLRRQRSSEARQLIGGSTAAARALFQQNLAQGQINRSNSIPEKPVRSSVIAQRINTFSQNTSQPTSPNHIKSPLTPTQTTPTESTPSFPEPVKQEEKSTLPEEQIDQRKTSPLKNIDKIKMSLESPSQIQYEPIIDPADLSPSTETEPTSFASINYTEYNENYRDLDLKQSEPMIKQNILENDMFDASYSSSNENDDEDSDNKFSTIKRSPYSKNTEEKELSRQNTVIENVNYKKENGTTTLDDVSPEGMEEEGTIYEDLDDDPGLTARALYDYQAADESEITFDPGDIITHIEQIDAGWWQGLGPHGVFGLFPANYVELLPCHPR